MTAHPMTAHPMAAHETAATPAVPAFSHAAFIRDHTELTTLPFLPECALHLATAVTPLWEATEATLAQIGLPPPYWAFAWVGGQAVARYVLDHPGVVAGRRVVDFAAGCGVAALAAARAGAKRVQAVDIDPFAVAAIHLNAAANGLKLMASDHDILSESGPVAEVILAGDVCYEKPMTDRVVAWLRAQARQGTLVLLGDPGRAYRPEEGLVAVARYAVPTTIEVENQPIRDTVIWRVLG